MSFLDLVGPVDFYLAVVAPFALVTFLLPPGPSYIGSVLFWTL